MTRRERTAFHRGILNALMFVAAHGQETLYREIVSAAGLEELLEACEGRQDFEDYGLVQFGYMKPRRRRPSAA